MCVCVCVCVCVCGPAGGVCGGAGVVMTEHNARRALTFITLGENVFRQRCHGVICSRTGQRRRHWGPLHISARIRSHARDVYVPPAHTARTDRRKTWSLVALQYFHFVGKVRPFFVFECSPEQHHRFQLATMRASGVYWVGAAILVFVQKAFDDVCLP